MQATGKPGTGVILVFLATWALKPAATYLGAQLFQTGGVLQLQNCPIFSQPRL